jgi:hypothetical protein
MPQPQFSPPTLEARDRAIAPEVIDKCRGWTLYLDLADSIEAQPGTAGAYLRCSTCDQGVIRLGRGDRWALQPQYTTPAQVEAGVLAHVLQVHRRAVDPAWTGA